MASQPVGWIEFRRDMSERGMSNEEIFQAWDRLQSQKGTHVTIPPVGKSTSKMEDDFPGISFEIKTLRNRGFSDPEIMKSITGRVDFLKKSGASGEAIDAWLKGRTGPLSWNFGKSNMGIMMPDDVKDVKTYIKNTEVTADEYKSVLARIGLAKKMGGPLPQGGFLEGALRGMFGGWGEFGSRTWNEMQAGYQQFEQGIRQAVAPESSMLERALGAGSATLGYVRAVPPLAAGTALTQQIRENVSAPIARTAGVPEGVIENPWFQAVHDTALGLALTGGLPKVTPAAELGTKAMLGEQAKGASAMRALQRKHEYITVTEPEVTPAAVAARMPAGAKLVTEEGPATVVAQSPMETVAVKTPADQADTFVKNFQAAADEFIAPKNVAEEGIVEPLQPRATLVSPREISGSSREAEFKGAIEEAAADPQSGLTGALQRLDDKIERRRLAAGFSAEQAKAVARHQLEKTQPAGMVEQQLEAMTENQHRALAAQALREFRISTGELTGKRGRPKQAEALQRGETRTAGGFDVGLEPSPVEAEPSAIMQEMMPRGAQTLQQRARASRQAKEVRLPGEEGAPQGAPAPSQPATVTIGMLRKLGDQAGWEVEMIPGTMTGGEGSKVYLIGTGGKTQIFDNMKEAAGFLMTSEKKPRSPAELKTPVAGESAFEAAVAGKALNGEQKINLAKQAKLMKDKPKLELATSELPNTEMPEAVKNIELQPNAIIGTVEDIATKNEAMKYFRQARDKGLFSRIIKTPDGFEVAYFREATSDVSNALALHKKGLQRGVDSLSESEHWKLGRAFGIPEDKIRQYIADFKTKPPISGGAPEERMIRAGMRRPPAEAEAPRRGTPSDSGLRRLAGMGFTETELPSAATRRISVANPMASGLFSESLPIRSLTRDMLHGTLAYRYRMRGFENYMKETADMIGGGEGSDAAVRAFKLKEGRIAPTSEADWAFLNRANNLTKDFAKRAREQGLLNDAKTLENYAPHLTDLDAMYDAFRHQFALSEQYADLNPALRTKLDKDEFEYFRRVFLNNPTRGTVTKEQMNRIMTKVFDFSDVISEPGNIPDFIKDRIPEEVYNRFMLPRSKNVKPIEDFFQAMNSYIGRTEFSLNFDPILEKWKPYIEQLPGSGSAFTERGFMESALNQAILHRPTWDTRTVGNVIDWVNGLMGRQVVGMDDINATATLMKSGWLRGALGGALDSAVRHGSHMLNVWAENGRLIGPMFKLAMKGGDTPLPKGVFSEFLSFYGDAARTDRKVLQTVMEADKKLNQIVLSPLHFTDFLAKGVAAWAGWEEAVAKGLDGTKALQVGFARASEVVPNLSLSQAQLHAIETLNKTQASFVPGVRAPAFTTGPFGRLSTTLMTWPTNQIAFMQAGLRQGFAEAFVHHDPARLLRFLAYTGFWTGGAVYAGSKLGADLHDMFGGHAVGLLVGLPFFRGVMNGINAIQGHDPMDRERAKDEFFTFLKLTTIPGIRYGEKVKKIYDNVDRGYAMDKHGRFLYETTSWGEIMKAFGVPPTKAYDVRTMSQTVHEMSQEYRLDRQKAFDAFFDQQSMEGLMKMSSKWGRPITMDDIKREMKNRMTTPMERAGRGMPNEVLRRKLIESGTLEGVR